MFVLTVQSAWKSTVPPAPLTLSETQRFIFSALAVTWLDACRAELGPSVLPCTEEVGHLFLN